jgi:hypothetical protein
MLAEIQAPDEDVGVVGLEAADHGEDERPAVVQRLAGSVQDVEDGVELLLPDIRVRDGGQFRLQAKKKKAMIRGQFF